MKTLYILLVHLLIAAALLITFTICCCFIKCQTKQKHLLLFYDASNKEIDIKIYYKMESNALKEIDKKLSCHSYASCPPQLQKRKDMSNYNGMSNLCR